jgi:membrane-associated phospholipid phosphatase
MLYLRHAACLVAALALATPVFAQEPQSAEAARADANTAEQVPGDGLDAQLPRPGQPPPTGIVLPASPINPETRNLARLIGQDFKNFFSKDTGQVMAITAISAIAAAPWDRQGVNNGFNIPTTLFEAGNIMGGVLFQASAGAGAYVFAKAIRNDKLAMVGRDVVRAQVLSQAMVQTVKFTVRRERPDGSNRQSFPSGHSASAFATATVLHRHYGWKLGVPAYLAGSYVALARMAWNRHHATDVVMGAGFGIASARTVTMSVGKTRLNLGVQPQVGGASINFTKIYQ